MDATPHLKLLLPGGRHRVTPITSEPFTIGRRRDNHLVLSDRDISRVQAIVSKEGDAYVIEDQQSLFGTAVNGEPIVRRALKNRDVVSFGRERTIEMVFLHEDPMSQILDRVDQTPARETSREELRNLRILLEISKGMNSFTSLTDLLELALDAVVDLTSAERGFLMLRDPEGKLQMHAARNMAGERIRPENLRISMSIVSDVMSGGRPIFLADALQSSDLRERTSIAELKLRSIACLPIRIPAAHMLTRPPRRVSRPDDRSARSAVSQDVIGVIYTDSSQATRPLGEVTRELVESIAIHSAISIENFLLRQEELEHRLIEREMEKLREIDRLKSDFVSHVSHELRTPLTAIKGSLDNMLDGLTGELAEKQVRYLHRMKSNTDHLVRLINDLLDLSRIEAGQIALNARPLPLASLIHEICESLRPLAAAKQITLAAESAELTVIADQVRLTQVLLNLTGNALKFTPSGGNVSIRAEAAGDQVRIAVRDNGVGLDPREQARIFERFYQIKATDGGPTVGTGLGLSITKSLVELHGGGIAVESALGMGSTFTVSLPIAGPPPPPPRPVEEPPSPPSGAPAASAWGSHRSTQG
ncbi:MAG: FHA domain-containing protein [Acidobacteria bacterium]|nr:FHA domain-containing protein [Acidobacteriota bacterium]